MVAELEGFGTQMLPSPESSSSSSSNFKSSSNPTSNPSAASTSRSFSREDISRQWAPSTILSQSVSENERENERENAEEWSNVKHDEVDDDDAWGPNVEELTKGISRPAFSWSSPSSAQSSTLPFATDTRAVRNASSSSFPLHEYCKNEEQGNKGKGNKGKGSEEGRDENEEENKGKGSEEGRDENEEENKEDITMNDLPSEHEHEEGHRILSEVPKGISFDMAALSSVMETMGMWGGTGKRGGSNWGYLDSVCRTLLRQSSKEHEKSGMCSIEVRGRVLCDGLEGMQYEPNSSLRTGNDRAMNAMPPTVARISPPPSRTVPHTRPIHLPSSPPSLSRSSTVTSLSPSSSTSSPSSSPPPSLSSSSSSSSLAPSSSLTSSFSDAPPTYRPHSSSSPGRARAGIIQYPSLLEDLGEESASPFNSTTTEEGGGVNADSQRRSSSGRGVNPTPAGMGLSREAGLMFSTSPLLSPPVNTLPLARALPSISTGSVLPPPAAAFLGSHDSSLSRDPGISPTAANTFKRNRENVAAFPFANSPGYSQHFSGTAVSAPVSFAPVSAPLPLQTAPYLVSSSSSFSSSSSIPAPRTSFYTSGSSVPIPNPLPHSIPPSSGNVGHGNAERLHHGRVLEHGLGIVPAFTTYHDGTEYYKEIGYPYLADSERVSYSHTHMTGPGGYMYSPQLDSVGERGDGGSANGFVMPMDIMQNMASGNNNWYGNNRPFPPGEAIGAIVGDYGEHPSGIMPQELHPFHSPLYTKLLTQQAEKEQARLQDERLRKLEEAEEAQRLAKKKKQLELQRKRHDVQYRLEMERKRARASEESNGLPPPPKKRNKGALCSFNGCGKSSQTGGFCRSHGGGSRCKFPDCNKCAHKGGLCTRHGGGIRCGTPGCTKGAQAGGYCVAHGGGRRCRKQDCTKLAQRGWFCTQHGASRSRKQKTKASTPPPSSSRSTSSSLSVSSSAAETQN